MELNDKVGIVTGASKGIGLAVTRLLLEQGMKVAGWSRTEPDVQNANFLWVKCDVGNHREVQAAFDRTIEALGNDLSVLVNNAGLGYEAKLEEMSLEQWQQMMQVNVNGIFYCSRLAIPLMKKRQEGHIINMGSIAGTTGIEGMSGYCATKFAVRGISQSLFKEVRNFGIKVTCINPGSVKTHFFDQIDSVTPHENMMRPQDVADAILSTILTHKNFHIVEMEMRPLKPKP